MMDSKSLKQVIQENIELFPGKKILSDSESMYNWDQFNFLIEDFKTIIMTSQNDTKPLIFFASANIESIAVIAACISLNICFVPIDPNQPLDRIYRILTSLDGEKILDPLSRQFSHQSNKLASSKIYRTDLLYILFTSGSTGEPKGVQITNDNLTNTLNWSDNYLRWQEDDKIGLVTNLFFDISIFDVMVCLTKSVPLHVVTELENPWSVMRQVQKHNITSLFSTPSLFSNLNRIQAFKESKLRRIISGGDFFPLNDIKQIQIQAPNLEIWNVWGPTETSIVNTMHQITSEELSDSSKTYLSIGKSTHQMPINIVDHDDSTVVKILPTGSIGEIMVSGKSVSPGYVNSSPEENARFLNFQGNPSYLTGDLGFVDEEGWISIVGRSNFLIKYQGYRIDPREIEALTEREFAQVRCCFMLLENERSVAYTALLIESPDAQLDLIGLIKSYLRESVPSYMVPKLIHRVPQLPFTANGKLDRQKCREILVSHE